MENYAVVGNPISHSKSPLIHALFAEQTKQTMHYDRIESPLEGFEQTVNAFFADKDSKGLNVTVPFKEEAWRLCDLLSDKAELAGAVNTLYLNQDGRLCGDNTDGAGLVRDLQNNHGCAIKGKRVLVVGAGGAVRGVMQPILKEMPREIVICNRTLAKAETLAELFSCHGSVSACSFSDVGEEGFDVIINGTSASLSGDLPPLPATIFAQDAVAYDMMYSPEETIFNRWAKESGAKVVIDGLGMLVEQAAEAFFIWRKVRPDTAPILKELRKN